jgi:hypothetical protein
MKRALLAIGTLLAVSAPALAQSNSAQPFTPVVQNAAYSSGNAMGGLQAVGLGKSTGIFNGFMIASKGGSTTAMTIYIFDTNPSASTSTDKTAFVLGAADVAKLAITPFTLTPAVVGTGTTATVASYFQALSIRNQDQPVQNLAYVCVVANGAVTPATTSDLVAKFATATD